jgi:hypothetical protein
MPGSSRCVGWSASFPGCWWSCSTEGPLETAGGGWHAGIRPGGGFEVIPTYHTSNQAFIGTSEVRAQRMADLADAFARTARMLQQATPPDGA